MDKSREELEKESARATAKLEQYQHRGQRYEPNGLSMSVMAIQTVKETAPNRL